MTVLYYGATTLSVIVFLYFGAMCVFADGMVTEFERYGLLRLRLLTGALELGGAVGLLAGQFIHQLIPLSAGGLATLMALAIITRIRARDSLRETLPAVVMMALNAFIVVYSLRLPKLAAASIGTS